MGRVFPVSGHGASRACSLLVFGGLGIGMVEGVGDWDPIAEALLAPSLDVVTHDRGRMFPPSPTRRKSDRLALAACIETSRVLVTREQAAKIDAPTLIAVERRTILPGRSGTGRRHAARTRGSTFPAATTCWPSATGVQGRGFGILSRALTRVILQKK